MFRIFYGRVYGDSKEATRSARDVSALHPKVVSNRGSHVVELGRYKTRGEADSAYFGYRAQGLKVFMQKLED